MKNNKFTDTVCLARIPHVKVPKENEQYKQFQGIVAEGDDRGKVKLFRCTDGIYSRIAGKESNNKINMGLRNMPQKIFWGHFKKPEDYSYKTSSDKGVIVSMDIVPQRVFLRGAAPVEWGKKTDEGFEVEYQEDIDGFLVEAFYPGLTHQGLGAILQSIRDHDFESAKSYTFTYNEIAHQISKTDEFNYLVRPRTAVNYVA